MLTSVFIAQVDTLWTARYNGPADGIDRPCAVCWYGGSSVFVTGTSYGSGTDYDYLTTNYHSDTGDTLWTRRYNGVWGTVDQPVDMACDSTGNLFVTGTSMGVDVTYDYLTIKYDPAGDTCWVRNLNGYWADNDYVSALKIDAHGNCYVTGTSKGAWTMEDLMTVKYNPVGDTEWVRVYDHTASKNDSASALAVDNGGNVYVAGKSWDYFSQDDYVVVKYDSLGQELWVKRYDGSSDSIDVATCICLDNLNNVIISGMSAINGHGYDIWTVKCNNNGDTLWTRRYNGIGNNTDFPYKILINANNDIYVIGYSRETNIDYCVIKYDQNGSEEWVRNYNGPGNGVDMVYDAAVDDSGSVYVTGASWGSGTYYDYATVKYDASGNQIWAARYSGVINGMDKAYAITLDDAGYVYVTGESPGAGTDADYITIKYSQSTGVIEDKSIARARNFLILNNSVFKETIEITCMIDKTNKSSLRIYDTTGRIVADLSSNLRNPVNRIIWSGKDINGMVVPPGAYFIKLLTPSTSLNKKIIKIN